MILERVRNVPGVWLLVEMTTSNFGCGGVLSIAFVHFYVLRNQSTDGNQSMKENHIKEAAQVTIQLKQIEISVWFFLGRSL